MIKFAIQVSYEEFYATCAWRAEHVEKEINPRTGELQVSCIRIIGINRNGALVTPTFEAGDPPKTKHRGDIILYDYEQHIPKT